MKHFNSNLTVKSEGSKRKNKQQEQINTILAAASILILKWNVTDSLILLWTNSYILYSSLFSTLDFPIIHVGFKISASVSNV